MEKRYILDFNGSEEHYKEACKYLAGGVGSNARLTPGIAPICFLRGSGSRMFDIDGNEFIDYITALGPLILGHCPPPVIHAVKKQLELGSLFGAAAEAEVRLAKMIQDFFPSIDLVSFHNSSSEAVHLALRVARAFTGKDKILKFEGCYHGWIDDELISVHPQFEGAMGLEKSPNPVRESPGQLKCLLDNTFVATFNRPDVIERIFQRHGNEIAAVILEPIPANNGVILPDEGFLEMLSELAKDHESLIIYDETITGLRLPGGSAAAYFNQKPDLTVFGKGLGGGYPIAGFGGTKEIMDLLAEKRVNRMGTFNSNQISVAAAIAVLEELSKDDMAAIKKITETGRRLMQGMDDIFSGHGIPVLMQGPGSFFSALFTDRAVRSYRDTFLINGDLYHRFWLGLLNRGVRIWATPRSLWFVSAAHSDEDVDVTLERISDGVAKLIQ